MCGVSLNDFSKLDLIVMVSFVATFPRVAVDKRFSAGGVGHDHQPRVHHYGRHPEARRNHLRGYRHATIIHEIGGSKPPDVQGFITSQNRFVEREEALKIARAARQMAGKRSHPTDLFSEDIWPTVDTTSPAA